MRGFGAAGARLPRRARQRSGTAAIRPASPSRPPRDGSSSSTAAAGCGRSGVSLLPEPPAEIDILLTHMHLDHVTGLGFFGPLFMNKTLRIWGPRLGDVPLADRLADYLGPPLFPMPFAEIPVTLEVTEVERETWEIGGLTVISAPVQHPGGALGYRLEEGDSSLVFIPDNELGLDADAGVELATGADILLHDAQYRRRRVSEQGRVGALVVVRLRGVCAADGAGASAHVPSRSGARRREARRDAGRGGAACRSRDRTGRRRHRARGREGKSCDTRSLSRS